jgi:hypothetical protein
MADVQIYCPSCDQKLSVPAELLGQTVECPQCHARFTAPVPAGTAPPPAVRPVADPADAYLPPYADDPEALARRAGGRLKVPAIVLIVLATIAAGSSAVAIAGAERNVQQMKDLAQDPNMPPELANFLRQMAAATTPEAVRVSNGVFLVLNLITLLGAVQMLRLRTYWVAVLGSILALNPLNCPCCILQAPFGLWALIVLMNADVRAAFR